MPFFIDAHKGSGYITYHIHSINLQHYTHALGKTCVEPHVVTLLDWMPRIE